MEPSSNLDGIIQLIMWGVFGVVGFGLWRWVETKNRVSLEVAQSRVKQLQEHNLVVAEEGGVAVWRLPDTPSATVLLQSEELWCRLSAPTFGARVGRFWARNGKYELSPVAADEGLQRSPAHGQIAALMARGVRVFEHHDDVYLACDRDHYAMASGGKKLVPLEQQHLERDARKLLEAAVPLAKDLEVLGATLPELDVETKKQLRSAAATSGSPFAVRI